MYDALNALGRGKFFWEYVVNQWPAPCSLGELGAVVLTAGLQQGWQKDTLLLVITPTERLDSEDYVLVQVRKPTGEAALLSVSLTTEGYYLSGSHNDTAVDETGAKDALALYAPFIKGSWQKIGLAR